MKIPSQPTNDVRRLNPHLYGPPHVAADSPPAALVVKPTTDEAKLNKTERLYLAYLRCGDYAWIGVQNITFKLGHDCRYTPDFITVPPLGRIQAREVKGFFRDDAKVKLQVAARAYPWIDFMLVRKTADGWETLAVKP